VATKAKADTANPQSGVRVRHPFHDKATMNPSIPPMNLPVLPSAASMIIQASRKYK